MTLIWENPSQCIPALVAFFRPLHFPHWHQFLLSRGLRWDSETIILSPFEKWLRFCQVGVNLGAPCWYSSYDSPPYTQVNIEHIIWRGSCINYIIQNSVFTQNNFYCVWRISKLMLVWIMVISATVASPPRQASSSNLQSKISLQLWELVFWFSYSTWHIWVLSLSFITLTQNWKPAVLKCNAVSQHNLHQLIREPQM